MHIRAPGGESNEMMCELTHGVPSFGGRATDSGRSSVGHDRVGCFDGLGAPAAAVRQPSPVARGRGRKFDAEMACQPRQIVATPAMTKSDCDDDRLRVAPHRNAFGSPDELQEEVFDVQLLEQEVQERRRPLEPCGTGGDQPKSTGAQLLLPLLRPSLLFEPARKLSLTVVSGSVSERKPTHGRALHLDPRR